MMDNRRFEIRPVTSRRLRAALFLVFVLGLIGISQTRLTGIALIVAWILLCLLLADGWRRTRMPVCTLVFDFGPLRCSAILGDGAETPLHCTQASVYPWLVVLQTHPLGSMILLPDSLPVESIQNWRRLLVWARLHRRQLSAD